MKLVVLFLLFAVSVLSKPDKVFSVAKQHVRYFEASVKLHNVPLLKSVYDVEPDTEMRVTEIFGFYQGYSLKVKTAKYNKVLELILVTINMIPETAGGAEMEHTFSMIVDLDSPTGWMIYDKF